MFNRLIPYLFGISLFLMVFTIFSGLYRLNVQAAGPLAWGKKGTAAVGSATLTAPFFPSRLCAKNEDATNGIYIDWTDGVAAVVDNSTNIYLQPGQLYCFEFNPSASPQRTFEIGIISTAATPAYHIHAYRFN